MNTQELKKLMPNEFGNNYANFLMNVHKELSKYGKVAELTEITFDVKHCSYNYQKRQMEQIVLSPNVPAYNVKVFYTPNDGKSFVNVEFKLPKVKEIYEWFAPILRIELKKEVKEVETIATIEGVELKEAIKFIAKDKYTLRSSLKNVLIRFLDGNQYIAATDAHMAYISKQNKTNVKDLDILVSEAEAKAILKTDYKSLHITKDSNGSIYINDIEIKEYTDGDNFPSILNVVCTTYKGEMVFEKDKLKTLIKQVLPAANRVTHAIKFHLNGSIQATGEDIDFNHSFTQSTPYIKKTFEDMDVAYNGKLLTNCLNSFKNDVVSVKIKNKNCVAEFTNVEASDTDTKVLLMPICI